MNILVTGVSGQIGSYVLEELNDRHHAVGIDTARQPYPDIRPFTSRMDIRDDRALEACDGVDAVVHLAAQVSVERSIQDPMYDCDVNLTGTVNMLRAASANSVDLFLYVSSAAVYGNPVYLPVDEGHPTEPLSFYGVSKMAAESYVRAFGESMGLPYLIVRPFNVYSPRADPDSPYSGVITQFVQKASSGRPLTVEGDGQQTRDFIHAQDVARMVGLGVDSGVRGETLNCGTGEGVTINDLASLIAQEAEETVEVVHVEAREGDIRRSVASIEKAEELLDFSPSVPLDEGLRSLLHG